MMAGTRSPRSLSPNGGGSLEVLKMQMDTNMVSRQSAMMVKLTEECIIAIKAAQRNRQHIRLKIDKQGGSIEIGSGEHATKFRFVIQDVPGPPADAVSYDGMKRYRTVATFQSKIQVQTTAKALSETRGKFIEEEKKKKLKESSRHKREQCPVTVRRATNPLAIGAQRPSPSSSARSHHSDSLSKNTTSKVCFHHFISKKRIICWFFSISILIIYIFLTTQIIHRSFVAGALSFVRAELSRRPLRKRVIHLIVLGRFSSIREVISQLRKDSLNEDIVQEDADRVQELVDEIGELNRETGKLQLKQIFYNEVDARWPGFSSDEKAYVRKILSGNMNNNITNFAPIRKTRIVPMVAPTSVHNNHAVLSVEDSSLRSGHNKSPEFTTSNRSSKSPSETVNSVNNAEMKLVTDDLSTSSNVHSSKRKAHGYPSSQAASKRARQQSLSPPEDPSNANFAINPQQTTKNINQPRTIAISYTDRPSEPVISRSSNIPLTSTPQVSRDWLKEFPEPRSLEEAEKYYLKFLEDYPKYLTCYNLLSAVVTEFKELEKKLNEAPKHTREHEKAEEAIEARYMHYQRNSEYLETKQKHEDLRSKLEVLKKHVDFWEKNYKAQFATEKNNSENGNKNSNHHISKNSTTL
ncbi:unnamed protein product [Thelazia callipaeda]|uniref:OCEL domain-containing protein n=1 Tax=Thelazia callipaeda TaxID=103827 RepID=A0A0N5CMH0_THECL|nr:unnamed protein product [Thelazia callipaeda]